MDGPRVLCETYGMRGRRYVLSVLEERLGIPLGAYPREGVFEKEGCCVRTTAYHVAGGATVLCEETDIPLHSKSLKNTKPIYHTLIRGDGDHAALETLAKALAERCPRFIRKNDTGQDIENV